jgi:hypothetical protein
MWLLSPSVVFYLCGVCSLPSFVIPLTNDPVFEACPSPGRKGPTRQTLQTRLVCCVLFSCLVLAPLMLSISFFHLLFVFSLSIDRHSFIGQSTSRLRPSRPAHTTLRFLSRYLFRSHSFLHLLFSICFFSLYRPNFIRQSTSRLPLSRYAHTTLRYLFRYLFRSLYLFFIFFFLCVSFSLSRHS